MRRSLRRFDRFFDCRWLAFGLVLLLSTASRGQDPDAGWYRSLMLADLETLEGKIVGLAEAIPAESYDWHPEEGVRSISEVLMHAAGANFFLPTLVGFEMPEGIGRDLETITDKDTVLAVLEDSFAHARQALEQTPDVEMAKPMKLFGQDSTVGGLFYAMSTHLHEHLGQTIGYARMNGVTPPWSGG